MTMNRVKLGQGIAGSVAASGEALIIKDAYEHPSFNPAFDKKTGFTTGSILCSPLNNKDEVIGVCQVIHNRDKGRVFGQPDLEMFQMFCDSATLAIQNAKMHHILMENQRFERDMDFAKSVQESFLPAKAPERPGLRFAGKTAPARVVGGDFYDFFELEEQRLGVVVGDVSGKGVPAALQMARLMSDFRYLSQLDSQTGNVLSAVNKAMCERSHRGMFTTVLYMVFDVNDSCLRVANGGHHPLLVRDSQGEIREMAPASGPPLGVLSLSSYQEETCAIQSGDWFLSYTDGLTEPKNPSNEEFGIERVKKIFRDWTGSPESLLEAIESEIDVFTEGAPPFDDLTCVVCRVL